MPRPRTAPQRPPAYCQFCNCRLVNPQSKSCRACLPKLIEQRNNEPSIPLPTKLPQPCNVRTQEQKLEVLIQRAENGEYLWHPMDVSRE